MNFTKVDVICAGSLTIFIGFLVAWCLIKEATPVKTTVEVIDGCEYLRYPAYYHSAITHKGNCKNH